MPTKVEILNDSYRCLAFSVNPTTQKGLSKEWTLRYTMKNPKDKLLVRVHNDYGVVIEKVAVNTNRRRRNQQQPNTNTR